LWSILSIPTPIHSISRYAERPSEVAASDYFWSRVLSFIIHRAPEKLQMPESRTCAGGHSLGVPRVEQTQEVCGSKVVDPVRQHGDFKSLLVGQQALC
jgi:hypothetical protein